MAAIMLEKWWGWTIIGERMGVNNNRGKDGVSRDLEAYCPISMEQFDFRDQDGPHIFLFF